MTTQELKEIYKGIMALAVGLKNHTWSKRATRGDRDVILCTRKEMDEIATQLELKEGSKAITIAEMKGIYQEVWHLYTRLNQHSWRRAMTRGDGHAISIAQKRLVDIANKIYATGDV